MIDTTQDTQEPPEAQPASLSPTHNPKLLPLFFAQTPVFSTVSDV